MELTNINGSPVSHQGMHAKELSNWNDKAGYKTEDPNKGHMHFDIILWAEITCKQHEYKRKSLGHFTDCSFVKIIQILKLPRMF